MIFNRKRRAVFLCVAGMSLCLLGGCKEDEAVHTSADTQSGSGEESGISENDTSSPDDAENGNLEMADSSAKGEDVTSEDGTESAEADSGRQALKRAQAELDEATRTELTEELLQENQMDTSVMENTRATKGCAFSLPEDFMEAEDMPGMYVTKRYPIDASTIYYAALEQDISLQLMTEESFKAHVEENFRQVYDEDISVVIDEYERIEIEGYPAFRILCHYQVEGVEISQLEYAINADKSYVITYSQTDEYDRMEEYEASAATIRLEY